MEKGQETMKFLVKKEGPAEEKGKAGKKRVIILWAAGMIIIAASAAVFLFTRLKKDERHTNMPPAMNGLGEGVVCASGLTAVGMLEETWDLDFLQTALYVEESYLSMGDEVEKGDVVFKVSDGTLEEARKELENMVTEAELAYRQGVIDYETGIIDARVTNENAAVNKKYSQAQYDNAAAQAGKNVKELEKQAEEARELVDEYTKSVNEDYYRTYYKIDERYQAYYEHFSLLMETYEKWDIEDGEALDVSPRETSSGQGEKEPDKAMAGNGGMGGGYNEDETLLSVYNQLDEMVKQEGEEYKTALENYETAKRTAQEGLEKARSELAVLEAEIVSARTEYEKQLIACKSDYEITQAQSDNAQAVYEVTLESLEETLTSLKNEKADAEENLALFEEVIGDGYFYTPSAGTIVMNAVREDSYLSGESLIIAYNNPEIVSVTASVDQSDIAGIGIGDSVYVAISGYGNYQGKVTMVNPVTQAQSRSSVTYQVTVALEGDVSALDSNLTAYVYFGMSDEMMQEMQNMPQDIQDVPKEMQNMPQDDTGNPKGDGGSIPESERMPGNRPAAEGIGSAPETGGRLQTGESEWKESMPQSGSNGFPGSGGKEEGQ
ncbi:MAG: HlyD family efflux transporter periplasmic adaptor subunit [Lachnospiraceae bacterium]|jgi:hypothetical protein|nr:HlyD family efflux transporter periplasmic adaptor subunit [Lachnospiraceae bacterium]